MTRNFRSPAVYLIFCCAIALSSSAAAQTGASPYHPVAPFPQPAEELFGATANGKVYVFGGLQVATADEPRQFPMGLVYEYDPAANTWAKKRRMPLPAHHVATAVLNGKIYLFGGFTAPQEKRFAWVAIHNAWEYDPAADQWKALKPMPTARGSAVAAEVNGKIYVMGGGGPAAGVSEPAIMPDGNNRSMPENEEYDPATDTWRSRAPMPTPRNHTVSVAVDGKIYVIGGRIGAPFIATSRPTDIVEEYDPATDRWNVGAPHMPTARSGHSAVVYKGRIFVAGGEVRDRDIVGNFVAMEAYDPAKKHWTILPPMPVPRGGFAGAAVGKFFYLLGGTVQGMTAPGMHTETELGDAYDMDTAF